jgi:hypothetical protein
VKGTFNERHGWADGRRIRFGVLWVSGVTHDCHVHAYRFRSRTHGAYESDCRSWETTPPGYDILLFRILVRNRADRATTVRLRNFTLVSRDGRSFGPVNVRSEAEFPPSFLNETMLLPPRAQFVGWLTFDGRVQGMVPAALSYIDDRQTLTQVFRGRHIVVPPGTRV